MYSNKITYSPSKPLDTIKLCTNCKYYKPVLFRKIGTCEMCGEIDISNGNIREILAEKARINICGEEGKYYEKKNNEFVIPHLVLQSDVDTVMYVVTPILWAFIIVISLTAATLKIHK